jgi:hypothetical protein
MEKIPWRWLTGSGVTAGRRLSAAILITLLFSGLTFAATLSVGPGRTFATPCRAFASAVDGDVIEIDASGSYNSDACGIYPNNLTIRGVNGRPQINADGAYAVGKGTWVVSGSGTVIENVEMFGGSAPDHFGAAIRLDGRDLTLRNSYLHDNENGLMTGDDGVSNVLIENCEFGSNGYGDGHTHNVYIGQINSLIFRYSYSHDAKIGHNLKSRASINTIVYNRFSSSVQRPSYEIELPYAGTAYVIGNVIQQPASNDNRTMLSYGAERTTNPSNDLYVVNNTFINDDSSGGTFIMVSSGISTPVLMQNNLFVGTGTVITQANAIDRSNYHTLSPSFVDRANDDLRPAPGSPVIDAGSDAGVSASGLSLVAAFQYKHVAGSEARPLDGVIDIGAYEAAPATTSGWVYCAPENGVCSFSGTRQVRYGANNIYAYQSASDSIICSNAVFGDPVFGVVKSCSYAETTTEPAWIRCSTENGVCSFTGTHQVRYGANNVYAYKLATGSIDCNNTVFGDPIFGVVKECDYAD